MKRILFTVITILFLTKGAYAMNSLAQMAVDLKKAGYSQKLTMYDNIYLIKADTYIRFTGEDIAEDYVVVPRLENLINSVREFDYVLYHDMVDKRLDKEMWKIKHNWITLEHENIWVVYARFWLMKKGKQ